MVYSKLNEAVGNNNLSGFSLRGSSMFTLDVENYDLCHFERGQNIYEESNTPRGVYIIKSGTVKITKMGCDGKQQILKLAAPEDYIGYKEILSDERYNASAIALEETTAHFIPKQEFFELLSEKPALLQNMMLLLSNEVATVEEKMVEMAYTPVRGRLIKVLLDLSGVNSRGDKMSIVNLSRDELSSIIGTATETVIRFLKELKEENVIAVNGRAIEVLDVDKLRSMSRMY